CNVPAVDPSVSMMRTGAIPSTSEMVAARYDLPPPAGPYSTSSSGLFSVDGFTVYADRSSGLLIVLLSPWGSQPRPAERTPSRRGWSGDAGGPAAAPSPRQAW